MSEYSFDLEEVGGLLEDLAKIFWERDGGGRDFHNRKWNHAAAEGYERDRLWEPYFPSDVTGDSAK